MTQILLDDLFAHVKDYGRAPNRDDEMVYFIGGQWGSFGEHPTWFFPYIGPLGDKVGYGRVHITSFIRDLVDQGRAGAFMVRLGLILSRGSKMADEKSVQNAGYRFMGSTSDYNWYDETKTPIIALPWSDRFTELDKRKAYLQKRFDKWKAKRVTA